MPLRRSPTPGGAGDPASDEGSGSSSPDSGPSLTRVPPAAAEPASPELTVLNVPHGMAWYVELHGAVFDKPRRAWVVAGQIPSELANFIPRPARAEPWRLPQPFCPLCGSHMTKVRSRLGEEFWGCSAFRRTGCRGSMSLEKHLDLLDRPLAPTALDVLAKPSATTASAAQPPQPPLQTAPTEELERSLSEIAQVAQSVLGNDVTIWLARPKVALGNETPVKLLRTPAGRVKVLDLLHKLRDYG